jgi:hypothetical protein
MVGQDFQDRLDAIVTDLESASGTGKTVQVMFRDNNNQPLVMPLSSDVNGVVDATQLANLQMAVDGFKPVADAYDLESGDITTANDAFKIAQAVHQVLIDDAKTSRDALSAALEADLDYQAAKDAVDVARNDAAYVAARTSYIALNISENYLELQKAKGSYVVV